LTGFAKSKWTPLPDCAPALDTLHKQTKNTSMWVASEIVLSINDSLRAEVVKRFIMIAEYFLKFNDFFDTHSILLGLKHPAIVRLSKTWKSVGKKYQKIMQKLESKLNPDTVRQDIKKKVLTLPVLPSLDMFLPEIEKIQQSQPTVLENGLVNFKRFRQESQIFEEFESLTNNAMFPFRVIPEYQTFLVQQMVILTEEELTNYSQECETHRPNEC